MANIVITPAELRSCATNLETYLEDYNKRIEQINTKLLDVISRWEGAAHDEFLRQYIEDLYPFLNYDIPNVVSTLISELTGVADAVDNTDAEVMDSLK